MDPVFIYTPFGHLYKFFFIYTPLFFLKRSINGDIFIYTPFLHLYKYYFIYTTFFSFIQYLESVYRVLNFFWQV